MINYPNYPQVDNVPPTQTPTIGYPGYQQGYQIPSFQQQMPTQMPGYPTQIPQGQFPGQQLPFTEQSYIENILRLNKGKVATVYMNFENSQWGSKIFKGEVLEAGKDHIILLDNTTGIRYLLLTIYLNYITFDEPINYFYPFSETGLPSIHIPGQTPVQPTPIIPPVSTQAPTTTSPFTQVRKKDNNQ